MSNQEQESTETKPATETTDVPSNNENIEKTDENTSTPSSEAKISNEQETTTAASTTTSTTRRVMMAQDIRYATEQGDRDKLMEKYENYQVSDSNSCIIRFLTDHRQKKNLFGRNEGTHSNNNHLFLIFFFPEENSNLNSIGKTFNTRIHVSMFIIFVTSSTFTFVGGISKCNKTFI